MQGPLHYISQRVNEETIGDLKNYDIDEIKENLLITNICKFLLKNLLY